MHTGSRISLIVQAIPRFLGPRAVSGFRDEKGSALIMAIVVMVIVAIVGTIGANMTTNDSQITTVFSKGSEGFYAGESGIVQGSSKYKSMKYDEIIANTSVISTPSEFEWPTEPGSDPNWDSLTSPHTAFQAYIPGTARVGRGRSKLADELGGTARTGATVDGYANAMLETSRLCVRSEGFSENPNGRVRTQLEQQIISYLPVQE